MLRRALLAAGAAVLAAACAAPAAHARIAFVTNREGDREIYLMDDAGGGLVNLTNDFSEDYDPAWSPDATRIAFTRDDGT
ncbi:MAG TPA: hypothetical protein VGJ70_20590, partial [Solirubrobacteraceae bacterium]